MSKTLVFCLFVFFISLFGLVNTKMHVQSLRENISIMETRRDKLLESVKVLKAEWAYLNNIDRLESLSNQYLKLSKLDLKKIKKIQDNKAPDIKIEIINETKEFKGSINWKYKAREVILKNSQDAKKKN